MIIWMFLSVFLGDCYVVEDYEMQHLGSGIKNLIVFLHFLGIDFDK